MKDWGLIHIQIAIWALVISSSIGFGRIRNSIDRQTNICSSK